MLTKDEFKAALPDKVRNGVNDVVLQSINDTLAQPEFFEYYRENLISYANVISEGKFSLPQYISAVKYCSYRFMGNTCERAYTLTFPDKIKRFADENVEKKDIASYITAYNKSKLVVLIMTQSMIPTHILNQDLHQKAINKQLELMNSAKSEMVQHLAAKTLAELTKAPETHKIELDINATKQDTIEELKAATQRLAQQQKELIERGVFNAQQIGHSKLIEGKAEIVRD